MMEVIFQKRNCNKSEEFVVSNLPVLIYELLFSWLMENVCGEFHCMRREPKVNFVNIVSLSKRTPSTSHDYETLQSVAHYLRKKALKKLL